MCLLDENLFFSLPWNVYVKWKISINGAFFFWLTIWRGSHLHISCFKNLKKLSVTYREWFYFSKTGDHLDFYQQIFQIFSEWLCFKTLADKFFCFWTLDVSRTVSYEVNPVHLSVCSPVRLSVHPSVTKFFQDLIISFFWYCTWR